MSVDTKFTSEFQSLTAAPPIATLETLADWKDDLRSRIGRAQLRFELAELDRDEIRVLAEEAAAFSKVSLPILAGGMIESIDDYNPFPRLERHKGNGASLVSTCASEIAIEPVEWIWPGRLAVGKHTCVAGEPGASKSQLTMYVAALVSTAGQWPCGEGSAALGSVIILSAEDGAADTIIPRLHAADADLGRVHIVSAVQEEKGRRSFNLQLDLALLEQEVKRIGDVVLIIIDPVSSYMGKTDSHKNAEVRGVLEPIGEFAERMRVAVLSVTHFSKAGANSTTKALHRFIGSIAFVGAPRIALAVIEDAENDRRLLLHAKNNLAPPPLGVAYRIKEKIVGEPGRAVTAPYVVCDQEHVRVTANEAIAADAGDSTASAEAEDFLRELLAEGPVPAKQIRADVEAAALSWSTVKRAKARLGIKADKAGMDAGWSWSLPRRGPRSPEEDHVLNMSPFVPDEPLRDQDAGDIPTFLDRRLNQGDLIASLKDESLRLKAKGLIDPPNDAA